MRVDRIDLQNFGSHRSSCFVFDERLTFVTGHNNCGKSSLRDAVKWGLLGSCQGTDARGAGVENLVAPGADAMKVTLGLVAPPRRRLEVVRGVRGRSAALEVDGVGGNIGTKQVELLQALGVSAGVLAALCDSAAFLDLNHADAKAMLMQVLNVHVDVEGERLTLEQLDTRYNTAFEERKAKKAVAGAIRIPPKPDDDEPDVAALAEQLLTLRDEEKLRLAEVAKDDGRRATLEQEHTTASNDVLRLEQEIRLTVDVTAALDEAETALAFLPTVDIEATQATRTALVDAEGRLRLASDTANAIVGHEPKKGCVLDASIPCKTPAKEFSGQVVALEKRVQELTAAATQAREEIARSATTAAERTRLEQEARQLRDRQAARATLMARRTELLEKANRLHDEIAALPALAAVDPDLVKLQERIARGEQTMTRARAAVDAWKRYRETTEESKQAAAVVAKLETKVEQLGPKGLRVVALAAAVGAFEDAINSALQPFGYELAFDLEPWTVRVNGRPIIRLSMSERLRVGLSLQLALADVTGAGFVLIDGVDMLDATNRGILVELLSQWTGQAIVTATRDTPPAAIDGIAVYWLALEKGVTSVERIGSEVHA